MVDQQQAISDDFSGSVFYCPADIFAVDRPYNAAVALKNPEQSVSGLEKQESQDESKKTTDIKQKRKVYKFIKFVFHLFVPKSALHLWPCI